MSRSNILAIRGVGTLVAVMNEFLSKYRDVPLRLSAPFEAVSQVFERAGYRIVNSSTSLDGEGSVPIFIGMLKEPENPFEKSIIEQYDVIIKLFEQRAFLIVPSNLLFSNHLSEKRFRNDLLQNNLIEKSIALPEIELPEMGFPLRVVNAKKKNYSLLVLDKSRAESDDSVEFFDCRFLPSEIEGVCDGSPGHRVLFHRLFADGCKKCSVMTISELQEGEGGLYAPRHYVSSSMQSVAALYKSHESISMGDVVAVIPALRPSSGRYDSPPLEPSPFHESVGLFTIDQISPWGYTVPHPEKSFIVKRTDDTALLHPCDIVLTIRGRLGAVGIITPDLSQDMPLAVHESLRIFRPKPDCQFDPRLLYLFLRSEVGQTQIMARSFGATVKMVHMKSLQNLPILIPDAHEAETLLRNFEEECRLSYQIREIESRIRPLSSTYLPLSS